MALSKKRRISSSLDIQETYKKGETIRGNFSIIKFVRKNTNPSKMAIVVPKAVSKQAVLRNKIKRKISESLKEIRIPDGINLTITAIPTILEKSQEEIKSDVIKNIKKISVN